MDAKQTRDQLLTCIRELDIFASVTPVDAGESCCIGLETHDGELFLLTVEES
jgi:hypothetical protein